jgi:hypothetical protein
MLTDLSPSISPHLRLLELCVLKSLTVTYAAVKTQDSTRHISHDQEKRLWRWVAIIYAPQQTVNQGFRQHQLTTVITT